MEDIIRINGASGKAKYKQIVESILDGINNETLHVRDKIPSLNFIVKEFGLSQDTALYAYNELKHRGIISSSIGKGYFITKTDLQARHNIFLLFDKMTAYKEVLYKSMKEKVGKKALLDIYFHHGNQKAFNTLIENAIGNYTAYIIVPIVSPTTDKILFKIPKKKVFIIDQGITRYGKKYRSVCQNFERDIIDALNRGIEKVKKYDKLYFVHKDQRLQFTELEKGFKIFCEKHHIENELLSSINGHKIKAGEMYILVDDKDLVHIIKYCKSKQMIPGQDIGIVSYNESPFKEIIADGITTITTDFNQMGQSIIEMIFNNSTKHIENPSKLIIRNSI